jgi:hypothetical protein
MLLREAINLQTEELTLHPPGHPQRENSLYALVDAPARGGKAVRRLKSAGVTGPNNGPLLAQHTTAGSTHVEPGDEQTLFYFTLLALLYKHCRSTYNAWQWLERVKMDGQNSQGHFAAATSSTHTSGPEAPLRGQEGDTRGAVMITRPYTPNAERQDSSNDNRHRHRGHRYRSRHDHRGHRGHHCSNNRDHGYHGWCCYRQKNNSRFTQPDAGNSPSAGKGRARPDLSQTRGQGDKRRQVMESWLGRGTEGQSKHRRGMMAQGKRPGHEMYSAQQAGSERSPTSK